MKLFGTWPIVIVLMAGPHSSSAQAVQLKGVITEEVKIPPGTITIQLPEDIRNGETISGTVRVSPSGRNEKEKTRNTALLKNYRVDFGAMQITITGNDKIPVNLENWTPQIIQVVDLSGNPITKFNIQSRIKATAGFPAIKNPSHILMNNPVSLPGSFDGNLGTTKITMDGTPLNIIAESPRQTICEIPQTSTGPHTLQIVENGKQTEKTFNAVDLQMTAPKTNLRRGEQTTLQIRVTGLEGIKEPAQIMLTNLTPSTIQISGGSPQMITILPSEVNASGIFSRDFNVQSINTGNFIVNANLGLPDPLSQTPTSTGTSNFTACDLGYIRCILPANICDQLKKGSASYIMQHPILDLPNVETVHQIENFTYTETGNYITPSIYPEGADNSGVSQIVYTYSKIDQTNNEKQARSNIVLDYDPADNSAPRTPSFMFDPGLYNFTATVYHHDNQQTVFSNYVIVPSQRNAPTVRNTEIDRLLDEERRIRDSVRAVNNRIKYKTDKIHENNEKIRKLDSIARAHAIQYNELVVIDATISQIPEIYGPSIASILEDLKNFKLTVGNLNGDQLKAEVDNLQKKLDDLQAELDACQKHLADLQQEQKDLDQEKKALQDQQNEAFRDLMDALRAEGYQAAGQSTRDRASGQLSFSYGLILRTAGGGYTLLKGIPAGALKTVSALENKIKAANNRIAAINGRQAALPGEINNAKKECDDIAARLAKAKAALQQGAANLATYNSQMAQLDEQCAQIKKLLEPLVSWCRDHPGQCSSFEYSLKKIMEDCPANLNALPNLMNQLQQVIDQKKKLEDQHKKDADSNNSKADELENQNQGLSEGLGADQDKAEDLGAGLDHTTKAQDKAIADEIARRQAEENAKNAARKKVCVEFLVSQAGSKEEADMLSEIADIKDQLQSMAENVKTASDIADKITKEKLKELTDKLRDNIDKLLEKFEKFDKLKDKLDQLLELKQDLETLTSSDDSAKTAADKMGVVLKRINNVLQEIGDKFPLLKLFVAYFGFMVDAYNAIITGAYNAITKQINYYLNQVLKNKLNCEKLVAAYQVRNNLEDAVAVADRICRADDAFMLGIVNNREKRRVYEEELRKLVLQVMMDCCLKWAFR